LFILGDVTVAVSDGTDLGMNVAFFDGPLKILDEIQDIFLRFGISARLLKFPPISLKAQLKDRLIHA
jgi:hypothetical protein